MIKHKYLNNTVFDANLKLPDEVDRYTWARQLCTAKDIRTRLKKQRGVLLSDDTGLGKTWVAALTALGIAGLGGKVLILVPNKVMMSKWQNDLYRVRAILGGRKNNDAKIRMDAQRLRKRTIALATHYQFSKDKFPQVNADLLVVDEAHRSKGDESLFRLKIDQRRDNFQGFLFLTATPFSISIDELLSALDLVAGEECDDRNRALKEFSQFTIDAQRGQSKHTYSEAKGLWNQAIKALRPWIIRHTIAELSKQERESFGEVKKPEISVPPADENVIEVLARTDRLLNMGGGPKGIKEIRGSDPRFHVGWRYLRDLLAEEPKKNIDRKLKDKRERVLKHIESNEAGYGHVQLGRLHLNAIRKALPTLGKHAKVEAVVDAVAKRVANKNEREKVVVFCHHTSTMHEVAEALAGHPLLAKPPTVWKRGHKELKAWKQAWGELLKSSNLNDELRCKVLEWVGAADFRSQVVSWFPDRGDWKKILATCHVRGLKGNDIPTILDAVLELAKPECHLIDGANDDEKELLPALFSHGGYSAWRPVTTAQSNNLEAQLALFNTPFGPDVLVAMDRLSEGIDLHRCCRILIHYELDPSPVRIRQREGRIRRVKGWAQKVGKPIEYYYPAYRNTRDEILVRVVRERLDRFDLLLGGAPRVDDINLEQDGPDNGLLDRLAQYVSSRAPQLATYSPMRSK